MFTQMSSFLDIKHHLKNPIKSDSFICSLLASVSSDLDIYHLVHKSSIRLCGKEKTSYGKSRFRRALNLFIKTSKKKVLTYNQQQIRVPCS